MDAKTRRKLMKVFIHMKERCYDDKDRRFKDWGGRGIKICQEWLEDSTAFLDWAIGAGYKPGLCIDRIDNDGDYSPDNCRWVTLAENNQNRRSSKFYTINGVRKNLQQWCDFYSVSRSMVNRRLMLGWNIEDALFKPKKERDTTSLIGKRFGFLTVKEFAGVEKNRKSLYKCECDCGKVIVIESNKLLTGHTKSCGCMHYKMRKLSQENGITTE